MKKNKLRLSEIIRIIRPFMWPITGLGFAGGYLLSAHPVSLEFFIAFLYFLVPYNLLLYGTEEISTLSKNSKEKTLNKQQHRYLLDVIILLNSPFIIYLLIVGSIASKIIFLTLIFLAITYSNGFKFKAVPFIDSIIFSLYLVGPLVFGLSLSNSANFYWPIIISVFLWAFAGCGCLGFVVIPILIIVAIIALNPDGRIYESQSEYYTRELNTTGKAIKDCIESEKDKGTPTEKIYSAETCVNKDYLYDNHFLTTQSISELRISSDVSKSKICSYVTYYDYKSREDLVTSWDTEKGLSKPGKGTKICTNSENKTPTATNSATASAK